MKKTLYILFAAAALAACSKSEQTPDDTGYGLLRLGCLPSDTFAVAESGTAGETAATSDTQPEAGDFALTITDGAEYTRTWERFAAFEAEGEHYIPRGLYTATVSYGDPATEGFGKVCYSGSHSFTILPRKTTEVAITARPVNAKVTVTATEQFCRYFHDIRLTLATSSGGSFDFFFHTADGTTPDTNTPVYVRAATTFTLTGKAYKQAATPTSQPVEVTLPAQQDIPTAAGKHYLYKFDSDNTGGARLIITIDDTVETVEIDGELNDGAKPNA